MMITREQLVERAARGGRASRGVTRVRVESGNAAMTFDEIAAELGTTRQNVSMLYESGMRKLASRPHVMRKLLELARERQRLLPQDPMLYTEDCEA